MQVSLFVTCLVDQLFPEVGQASVALLKRLGMDVQFDPRQTCCGQPAFNSGYVEEARTVALSFLRVFRDSSAIVVPSGSCATMIKVFIPGLFKEGQPEHDLAVGVADRTWELSDFIVSKLGVENTDSYFPHRVTYHDSCHLLRELGISEQPRQLLGHVRGLELTEMDDSDRCCGFGGTFSVKFPEISVAIGEEKLNCIADTAAEFVVANDISCLMHLDGLARREERGVRVIHLAQVLAAQESDSP